MKTIHLPFLLILACSPLLAEDKIPLGLAENITTFAGQNHYFVGVCGQISQDQMREEREAEKEEALEVMEISEEQFYLWHSNGVEQAREKWESMASSQRKELCTGLPGNVVMPEFLSD